MANGRRLELLNTNFNLSSEIQRNLDKNISIENQLKKKMVRYHLPETGQHEQTLELLREEPFSGMTLADVRDKGLFVFTCN